MGFDQFHVSRLLLLVWIAAVAALASIDGNNNIDSNNDVDGNNNDNDDNNHILEMAVRQAHNRSLLWGTYRPNLYFGTRSRTPETLLSGLMWFGVSDLQSQPWDNIRHSCEHDESLAGYAWTKHSGRSYGDQAISDIANNISMRTQFLKPAAATDLVEDTKLTADLERIRDADRSRDDILGNDASNPLASRPSPFMLRGETPLLGKFAMVFHQEPSSGNIPPPIHPAAVAAATSMRLADLRDPVLIKAKMPGDTIWKIKDHVRSLLVTNAQKLHEQHAPSGFNRFIPPANMMHLGESSAPGSHGNVAVFQQTFRAPFSIDIALVAAESEFDSRFEATFHLTERGFSESEVSLGKMLLSNMIGGMGYFHGTSIVDRSLEYVDSDDLVDYLHEEGDNSDDDLINEYYDSAPSSGPALGPQEEGPTTLFTDVPSRPFFPRGFYWDTGFHQHIIGVWDNALSLDVISHWASLIDENGWVGREQILGDEPRSKVPKEFQTQYSHFANPPTLVTALLRYLDRLKKVRIGRANEESAAYNENTMVDDPQFLADYQLNIPSASNAYLKAVYPSFKRQYMWFRRTQWGQISEWNRKSTSKEAFRWRGRKGQHTLTSGLDDYPRSNEPHTGELHVDLLCWMSIYAKTLGSIAEELEIESDVAMFAEHYKNMLVSLEELHWDEVSQSYTDLSINDRGESYHVVHKGYISLFPLLLGLLEHDSPHLGAILNLIENKRELWTPYGIASLSQSDAFFGTGENYWRGPIWININYLVLQSLFKNYIGKNGPYQAQAQRIYNNLRSIIITNVHKEYVRTGYVWEQYSPHDGQGKRSHPFTGWTALVLLIMSEDY
ncbi:hypothetical protein BSLG_003986 [Batrachochytrium salamandrivorans]|nr:hypothetical protein BSLG_003986 [Batrachochytrium salamandrivorans]